MAGIHPVQAAYVVAFAASGFVSLAFARWIAMRYEARGTRVFTYVLVAIGLWGANSALRTLVADSVAALVLLSTEMLLLAASVRLWFIFSAQYANRSIHRDRRVQLGLNAFVAVAFFASITNPLHHLVWTRVEPVSAPFLHYTVVKGPGHYALTVLAYVLVAGGLYFLVSLFRATRHMRAPIAWLVFGFLAVVLSNAIPYAVSMPIDHSTTVAPLGAMALALAAGVAIRRNLFAVRPIARDAILDDLRDPLLTLDRNGRIVGANEAFVDRFGDGGGEEPTGRRPATEESLIHARFDERFPNLAARLDLDARDPTELTVPEAGPDRRHYAVSMSPLRTGSHLLGHTLLFKDVTVLTESKLELERQNAHLDEFSDSVAHDLRNPLTVVSGFAAVLDSHLSSVIDGDDEIDEYVVGRALEKITANTAQMDEIVSDFLRVTQASKSLTALEPVAFEEAVDGALASLDISRGMTVTVRRGGFIYADPDRLATIVRTVLRSAEHRWRRGMTVEASLTDDGFVVEDTGEPVSFDQADRLLQYGYTTAYRGRGLGLSVAKTLAEVHRWDIEIDSTYDEGLRLVVSGARTEPASDPAAAERDIVREL